MASDLQNPPEQFVNERWGHMTQDISQSNSWKPAIFENSITQSSQNVPEKRSGMLPFGEDGLTFFDILDIVNPFQHIPVLSSLYRTITGDTIDPAPRIAGGTLFFGPLGGAVAAVNAIVEYETGDDLGSHAMALLKNNESEKDIDLPKIAQTAGWGKSKTLLPETSNNAVTTWAMGEMAWMNQQASIENPRKLVRHKIAEADLTQKVVNFDNSQTNIIVTNLPKAEDARSNNMSELKPIAPNLSKYHSAAALGAIPHTLNLVR